MARLFPLRTETPTTDATPRVVDLDDEDADDVFGALSSATARQIYATLDADPGTPSDVAEEIDSSIQNVRYHLEKLEDAGLVEVVDTWYSSRGNEMSVYGTANGPLIVTSDESRAAQLKQAVSRYIGGVGAVGGASLLVQATAERTGAPGVDEATGSDDNFLGANLSSDSGDAEGTRNDGADFSIEQVDSTNGSNNTTADASDGPGAVGDGTGGDADGVVDALVDAILATVDGFASLDSPGLLFFLGGVAVLTALAAWWYFTTYRHTTPA